MPRRVQGALEANNQGADVIWRRRGRFPGEVTFTLKLAGFSGRWRRTGAEGGSERKMERRQRAEGEPGRGPGEQRNTT